MYVWIKEDTLITIIFTMCSKISLWCGSLPVCSFSSLPILIEYVVRKMFVRVMLTLIMNWSVQFILYWVRRKNTKNMIKGVPIQATAMSIKSHTLFILSILAFSCLIDLSISLCYWMKFVACLTWISALFTYLSSRRWSAIWCKHGRIL